MAVSSTDLHETSLSEAVCQLLKSKIPGGSFYAETMDREENGVVVSITDEDKVRYFLNSGYKTEITLTLRVLVREDSAAGRKEKLDCLFNVVEKLEDNDLVFSESAASVKFFTEVLRDLRQGTTSAVKPIR